MPLKAMPPTSERLEALEKRTAKLEITALTLQKIGDIMVAKIIKLEAIMKQKSKPLPLASQIKSLPTKTIKPKSTGAAELRKISIPKSSHLALVSLKNDLMSIPQAAEICPPEAASRVRMWLLQSDLDAARSIRVVAFHRGSIVKLECETEEDIDSSLRYCQILETD